MLNQFFVIFQNHLKKDYLIYDYYYALYMANEKNYKIKDFKKYIPEDINIQIKPPERKIEKHEMFTFLDKDDVSE